ANFSVHYDDECHKNGPGGGGRTHTALRPPDFEPGASASSATPGQYLKIAWRSPALKTPREKSPCRFPVHLQVSWRRRTRRFLRNRVSPTAEELSQRPSPPPSPPECPSPYLQTRGRRPAQLPALRPPARKLRDRACSSC